MEDLKNDHIQADDETLELPEVAESEEDTTDWKAEATKLQQKAIRQREKTKELKAKLAELEAANTPKKEEKKSSEFDSGETALLRTYGITKSDEIEFTRQWRDKYGGKIIEVCEDEVFNAKLKILRDAKVVKEAIPESTKRSVGTISNKVDYWTEKYMQTGNLADVPKDLQRDVLNARLKAEENRRKFGG